MDKTGKQPKRELYVMSLSSKSQDNHYCPHMLLAYLRLALAMSLKPIDDKDYNDGMHAWLIDKQSWLTAVICEIESEMEKEFESRAANY